MGTGSAFFTVTSGPSAGGELTGRYSPGIGMVVVAVGSGRLFLSVDEAAGLRTQLDAAIATGRAAEAAVSEPVSDGVKGGGGECVASVDR